MKTSYTQFDMMVTYMEQNGDLSKPSTDPRGRIQNIGGWQALTATLNSDSTGESKTTEKWKKVWSDFKNNTKRKATRIHRAASGTGGGPALHSKLTDLEQRVLAIVGPQAATGLVAVEEAGVLQESAATEPPALGSPAQILPDIDSCASPVQIQANVIEDIVIGNVAVEEWERPGPSNRPHVAPQVTPPPTVQPSMLGHTPTRRTAPRLRSPRHRTRAHLSPRAGRTRPLSSRVDQVAQDFLSSDAEWRKLQLELAKMKQENERERLRLTEMQLQIQRDWQTTANRVVNILDKFVDKYCSKD